MNAFLWVSLALYAAGTLLQLSRLSSGAPDTPTTPSTRVVLIVVNMLFMAWIGYLLVTPAA